jgi:hypothetical protein
MAHETKCAIGQQADTDSGFIVLAPAFCLLTPELLRISFISLQCCPVKKLHCPSEHQNPPWPPFFKGGKLNKYTSPFEKGGLRGIF